MTLSLEEAKDIFLTDKRKEEAWKTAKKYESVLNVFSEWVEEADIESLDELNGGDLYRFKQYCREDRENSEISLNGTLAFLKVFLEFCEDTDTVEEGLADKVPVPSVDEEDEVSDEMPDDEHMRSTLTYYREYDPASRIRVELELASTELLRLGAQRAIDECDYDPEEQTITLRHRPEGDDTRGTPLKNKQASNRKINVSDPTNEAIRKYLETRDSVEDEYGRNPLLATDQGRVSEATVRRDFYKALRPCETNQGCPHGRTKSECEWTKAKEASGCPSSYSPHPVRRWGIVDHLNQDVPIEQVSDRADVSVPTLKKHYDPFAEERERQERKEVLTEHHDAFGSTEESSRTQSAPTTTDDPVDVVESIRPVDIIVQPIQERLDTPLMVEWFIDDLRAARNDPTNTVPEQVIKGVATYSILTSIVEISPLLMGFGELLG